MTVLAVCVLINSVVYPGMSEVKIKKTLVGAGGLAVTSLSFGAAPLGNMPDTYGHAVNDESAAAVLRRIFEGPVNMLDTSRNYGFGRSEERIGAVIREMGRLPSGFVLSTKIDRNMETNKFDAAAARRSVEESLETLSLDKADILHLHDPEHADGLHDITRPGGALDELVKMKEEGLASLIGLAAGAVNIMVPLLKNWPFDVLISHNRFTVLNRNADEMFNYAHENGIAVFNAAPYASGILAKGSANTQKLVYQDADDAALAPVRMFEALCARCGVEPGAAALQFSMRDPRITSTIVGVSRPERIEANLAWAEADIPDGFWDELAQLPFSTEDPEANRAYKPG